MYGTLDRSKPCPFPLPPTATYLGENELGYYHMDGFFDGLGNMFKRMVKFTPKSFTPGNIWKAVRNTTLTTATFGAYQLMPKSIKKTMERVGDIAIPVVAGGIAAVTLGPAVMGFLGPKLSMAGSLLGKSAQSIGSSLFGMLGKLPQSKQAEIAGAVTPNDIAYAETHQGQYPPHIMSMVDQAERDAYQYAATQQMNTLNPSLYGSSQLYPGLQSSYAPQPEHETSTGSTGLTLASGALLLYLLRK